MNQRLHNQLRELVVELTGATVPRITLRSSIWVEREGRWVLAFHQGTPAAKDLER